MAKKGSRVKIGFTCTVCGNHNYTSEKSKLNTADALSLKKYCPVCRKTTPHKEKKKLD